MHLDEARETFERLERLHGSIELPEALARSIEEFEAILEEEQD